jgi:hypothetical protein
MKHYVVQTNGQSNGLFQVNDWGLLARERTLRCLTHAGDDVEADGESPCDAYVGIGYSD